MTFNRFLFCASQAVFGLGLISGSAFSQPTQLLYLSPGETMSPRGDLVLAAFADEQSSNGPLSQTQTAHYFLAKVLAPNLLQPVSDPVLEADPLGPDPRGYGPSHLFWSRQTVGEGGDELQWADWVIVHRQLRKASDLTFLIRDKATSQFKSTPYLDIKYSDQMAAVLKDSLEKEGINFSIAKLSLSYSAVQVVQMNDQNEVEPLSINWFELDQKVTIEIEDTFNLENGEDFSQSSVQAIVEIEFKNGEILEKLLKIELK